LLNFCFVLEEVKIFIIIIVIIVVMVVIVIIVIVIIVLEREELLVNDADQVEIILILLKYAGFISFFYADCYGIFYHFKIWFIFRIRTMTELVLKYYMNYRSDCICI